jgi:hypothetical protein
MEKKGRSFVPGDFEISYDFIASGDRTGPFVGSLNFYILIGVAGFIVVAVLVGLCIYLCCSIAKNKRLEK